MLTSSKTETPVCKKKEKWQTTPSAYHKSQKPKLSPCLQMKNEKGIDI